MDTGIGCGGGDDGYDNDGDGVVVGGIDSGGDGSIGPRCEKPCLWRFANNKGADQPAHPRRLISAFVISLLERIISTLATSEISLF